MRRLHRRCCHSTTTTAPQMATARRSSMCPSDRDSCSNKSRNKQLQQRPRYHQRGRHHGLAVPLGSTPISCRHPIHPPLPPIERHRRDSLQAVQWQLHPAMVSVAVAVAPVRGCPTRKYNMCAKPTLESRAQGQAQQGRRRHPPANPKINNNHGFPNKRSPSSSDGTTPTTPSPKTIHCTPPFPQRHCRPTRPTERRHLPHHHDRTHPHRGVHRKARRIIRRHNNGDCTMPWPHHSRSSRSIK